MRKKYQETLRALFMIVVGGGIILMMLPIEIKQPHDYFFQILGYVFGGLVFIVGVINLFMFGIKEVKKNILIARYYRNERGKKTLSMSTASALQIAWQKTRSYMITLVFALIALHFTILKITLRSLTAFILILLIYWGIAFFIAKKKKRS